ncbi:MAG: spore cortex biosynthesis protein YabQ [Oscillospiraceae bacterium]|nr:spore cortex biosynthesis protein YabQ [Oscillospiraceae bacterium]
MQIETFFSISQQTAFFLLSVVLGAALGVVYDIFRVFRILFPPAAKSKPAAVQDVLFWLIYGFCMFCYSTAVCGGSLRFFMLFGSLIGFALYIVTVGNLIVGTLRQIAETVRRILRKVYSVLFEPIVKILKNFCQKVSLVFVRIYKKSRKTERSTKKLLPKTIGLVYNKYAKLGSSVIKRKVGGDRGERG